MSNRRLVPNSKPRRIVQRETLYLDSTTRERFYSAMRARPIPGARLRKLMNEDDTRFKLVE